MKKMLLIFTNSIRRSKTIILVAFLGGLALCVLFNLMNNLTDSYYQGIPVGFLAHEETDVTADFRSYMIDNLGMEVTELDDIDMLNTELVERRISAIVELPEGFETGLLSSDPETLADGEKKALLVSFLDDYANAAFVQAYLENYTASIATLALGADGDPDVLHAMLLQAKEKDIPIHIETSTDTALIEITQKNAFRQALGFYLMFSFLLAISVAQQLFDDRQKGLYRRIKTSNVRSSEYITGVCLMGMICSIALVIPLILYIQIAGISTGMEIWQAILLCFIYAFFVVGFALASALFFKTKNSVLFIITITSTITSLLGGAYFPTSYAPEVFQQLSRITPQFWFIDAVEKLQENPNSPFAIQALIIALFALFCYILAGVRFAEGGKKRRNA